MAEVPKYVDLSAYYNHLLDDEIHHKPGNNLAEMPHGLSELAGTRFDVRGLIQLSGRISREKTGLDYPPEVTGIPVNSRCERLVFLHGASWHDDPESRIGEYRVHYAGGRTEIIPIVYQVHVTDWWVLPGDTLSVREGEVAWVGDNERTRDLDYSIQIYKFGWMNPLPDIEISTIDFISAGRESAPFLMAITLE